MEKREQTFRRFGRGDEGNGGAEGLERISDGPGRRWLKKEVWLIFWRVARKRWKWRRRELSCKIAALDIARIGLSPVEMKWFSTKVWAGAFEIRTFSTMFWAEIFKLIAICTQRSAQDRAIGGRIYRKRKQLGVWNWNWSGGVDGEMISRRPEGVISPSKSV